MVSSCTNTVDRYADQTPTIDVKEFFDGEIKGWGLVHDRRGRVTKRFDFKIIGTWDGDKGILDEEFLYYDGETQTRQWRLEYLGDGKYKGFADDIIGEASLEQSGNALNLKYELIVPVNNSDITLKFDDWIWQMNDGVAINRAVMRKFGIRVGELTVVMQKI